MNVVIAFLFGLGSGLSFAMIFARRLRAARKEIGQIKMDAAGVLSNLETGAVNAGRSLGAAVVSRLTTLEHKL